MAGYRTATQFCEYSNCVFSFFLILATRPSWPTTRSSGLPPEEAQAPHTHLVREMSPSRKGNAPISRGSRSTRSTRPSCPATSSTPSRRQNDPQIRNAHLIFMQNKWFFMFCVKVCPLSSQGKMPNFMSKYFQIWTQKGGHAWDVRPHFPCILLI